MVCHKNRGAAVLAWVEIVAQKPNARVDFPASPHETIFARKAHGTAVLAWVEIVAQKPSVSL